MTTVHLESELSRVLGNLTGPEGRDNGARIVSPDEQGILVRELERTLADPPYMAAYLEAIRPLVQPSAADLDLLTDEQIQQVVAKGLEVLSPEQVRQLALDLPTLLALRDRIVEELPSSDRWWRLVKEWADRRGALRTAQEVLTAAGLDRSSAQ
jgi:hypothetical protein